MKFLKFKIVALLISSLLLCKLSYAGHFINLADKIYFMDDNGKFATGWRWIDVNGDNIAECYRFNSDGSLVSTKSVVNGKEVNASGIWEVDGVIQRIYKTTGRPLYVQNAAFRE